VDARPVYGKGEAPHEQRLPDSLLQHHPLCVEHQLLPLVGIDGAAGLAHQRGNVAVGG